MPRRKDSGKLAAWLREAGRKQAKVEKASAAKGGKFKTWLSSKPAKATAPRRKPAKARATVRKAPTARPTPQRRVAPPRRAKQAPVRAPRGHSLPPSVSRRIARQREDEKREAKFRGALKGFRVRKSDLGKIVFVAAKGGGRVGKGFRGKVYALHVTRRGTVRPYKERGTRSRPPVSRTIRSLDPSQFTTRTGRKAAEAVLYASTSRVVAPVVIKSKAANGIDWDARVVPAAIEILNRFVGVNTQSFQAAVAWSAVVAVTDPESGEEDFRTYQGAVDWKLSRAQVEQVKGGELPTQWVLPFIQSKLYADVAGKIGESEFVTMGSARFVQRLAANKGKDRSDWIDGRGRKWEKWDYQDVRLLNLTLDVRLVNIGNGPA